MTTPNNNSLELDELKKIHAPVIQTMEQMGFALLKDGDTFYKVGYELAPREHTTFSMQQAYEIKLYIDRKVREGRIDELRRQQSYILRVKGDMPLPNPIKDIDDRIKQLEATLAQEGGEDA